MTKIEVTEILIAQRGRCFYCGKPMGLTQGQGPNNYTRDHFYPKCRGNGLNGNTVLAHLRCNMEKGDRKPTPDEEVRFRVLYRRIKERRAAVREFGREVA